MKNKNRYTVLFIDGENILHQSFHKFEKLKSADGKPTGAVFGFLKSLHMYITRFDPKSVLIIFDNGKSPYRLDLCPEYKAHRQNISIDYNSFQAQKKLLMRMLRLLKIEYVFDKDKEYQYEGDDYLAYLVLHYKDNLAKCDRLFARYGELLNFIIISSDKDFNQLINHEVKIYNPRKSEMVRSQNCKDIFGYDPEETVDWLCMVGDHSDDIKGIEGIGPVRARKILDQYGTLERYLKSPEAKAGQEDIYYRNRKLIDLKLFQEQVPLPSLPLKTYNYGKGLDGNKWYNTCITYSFSSFLTNEFMEPFFNLFMRHETTDLWSFGNR